MFSINTFKTLYLQVTIYVSHYNVVKLFQRLLKFKDLGVSTLNGFDHTNEKVHR